MIAAMMLAGGSDVPTHAVRYRDPGVEPLGDPKPIGVGCRPMDPAWAEQIVDQCARYSVPVFVKQLGGHPNARAHEQALVGGKLYTEMPA